jgi:hypothetical protein
MTNVIIEVKANESETADASRQSRIDIVDLFEEMLTRRAELGFRPVLFVSNERDLECNLIGLYEREVAEEATGESIPTAPSMSALRRRLR